MTDLLHLGSCSWKYPSWRGLVYSDAASPNYLQEYAQHYETVEIDQWFWSLFGPDKVVLPQPRVVAEYASSVPDNFRFGVKMPNAITMSHFHQEVKTAPLVPNPHFLSLDLLRAFLDLLAPMREKLGPMMFQFPYLNKTMMSSQAEFLDILGAFVAQLPTGYTWCVETRNPNYLNDAYFAFLRERSLAHVWQQGYYMPPIFGLYEKYADQLTDNVVIRLHGLDRAEMDKRAGKDWSKLIEPHEEDLDKLARMLKAVKKGRSGWLYVNNHYEGCAPLTIKRLKARLES